MAQATIIDETEMTISPIPGETKAVIAITYQTEDRPPRTVYIDKDKYTDETVKEAIKADIEKATRKAPRTLEL